MLENFLKLEGVTKLDKKNQRTILGGKIIIDLAPIPEEECVFLTHCL